jgi:hypothetical protein
MNALSALSNGCLFLTALFAILCYLTSSDSVYETVEGDIVSTKKVFLILSIMCFIGWLVIEFSDYF